MTEVPIARARRPARLRILGCGILAAAAIVWHLMDREFPPAIGAGGAPVHFESDPVPSHPNGRNSVAAAGQRIEAAVSTSDAVAEAPARGSWQDEVGTQFSLPRTLVTSPTPLEAGWLLRNRSLNPRDVYLPIDARQVLAGLFGRHRDAILFWRKEVATRGESEFARAIRTRTLQPVAYDSYLRSLTGPAREQHDAQLKATCDEIRRQGALEGLDANSIEAKVGNVQIVDPLLAHGFVPYLSLRMGNQHYACRLADLPDTALAVRQHEDALRACLQALSTWFERAGALTEAETRQLADELEREIAKNRRS
jgi:hypothetical protein